MSGIKMVEQYMTKKSLTLEKFQFGSNNAAVPAYL
jgi:hypothetical protein